MKHSMFIVGGALVALVIIIILLRSSNDAPALVTYTEPEVVDVADRIASEVVTYSGTESLRAVLDVRTSGYCTFASDDEGVTSTGEFWFDGEQFALAATSRVASELYTSNIINDGTQTFFWGGTAAGQMAVVVGNDISAETIADEAVIPVDRFELEEVVTYTCEETPIAQNIFVPPGTVTFTDMDALLEGMFEGELRGVPEGLTLDPVEPVTGE